MTSTAWIRMLALTVALTGCGDKPAGLPGLGEPCLAGDQCGPGLQCVKDICLQTGDASWPKPTCPDAGPRPDALPLAQCPSEVAILKAGSFAMGSPSDEKCRELMGNNHRETLHSVTLTHAFELGAYEVTQGQFGMLMGYNPSGFGGCGAFCPVENLTWHEAAAYVNALSVLRGLSTCYEDKGSGQTCTAASPCTTEETCIKGRCARFQVRSDYAGQAIYTCPGYRLPTEAEWEYAYRAGTSTALYTGALGDCVSDPAVQGIAWYAGNANSRIYPSCMKAANSWGLHDMAGNVAEWIHDWYSSDLGSSAVKDPTGNPVYSAHVVRGGDYTSQAHLQRAAFRRSFSPWLKGKHVGFRWSRSR